MKRPALEKVNRTASLPVASAFGVLLAAAAILAGCALGPDYKRPPTPVPTEFRHDPAPFTTNALADLPWWQVFRDLALRDLIAVALTNNYDVRIAVSRVEQSRQMAAQARAQYFPAVGYQGDVSRGKNEFNGSAAPSNGRLGSRGEMVLGATWELDLWGRLRRLNEAARAQFLASDQARRGVRLSLVSDLAADYFELLELDKEREIARRATNSFGDSLRLFGQRLKGGVASKLETSTAAGALATSAAQLPELELQIALKENQINYLLGRMPGHVPRGSVLYDQTGPPEVPSGLPSSLLERRPDILEAEQLLRAANAQIGVTEANMFPKIGLTALLGKASLDLSTITAGSANVFSVGANAAGPIFQGGLLRAAYRQAKAAREEARLHYQQTTLFAFQDVSNALMTRERHIEVRAEQERAVGAYAEAVKVSTQRYVAGRASYYEVLQAQQQLFPAEDALARTRLNQLLGMVALYKALGGGWQLKEPGWELPRNTAAGK